VFRRSFLFLSFFAFLASASAFAELNATQRAKLWEDVAKQNANHPMILFSNGEGLPDYPGFVMSNELSHSSMGVPEGGGDLQVGAGTVINFNIAAARKTKSLVMVDQSPEVVAMNLSYYRPLFLASETPAEFAAFMAGIKPVAGESVEDVFYRVRAGEKGNAESLKMFDQRLAKLAQRRLISAVDRKFANAVASDQVFPPRHDGEVELFVKARGGRDMFETFMMLYDFKNRHSNFEQEIARSEDFYRRHRFPEGAIVIGAPPRPEVLRAQIAKEKQTDRITSFLNPEGFAHVRGLFQGAQVRFAQSRMEDGRFWNSVATFAREGNRKLADVYVSNIPSVVDDPYFRDRVLSGMTAVPRENVVFVEAPYRPQTPFATYDMKLEVVPDPRSKDGGMMIDLCVDVLERAAP